MPVMILAFFLFTTDRIFKYLILEAPESVFFLLPRILDIKLYKNYGVGFGIEVPRYLIIALSIGFIIFFGWLLLNSKKSVNRWAAILIIFGALSNLIDRLTYGFVIDYISLLGISFTNFADLMIWVGILRILLLR